MNQDETEKTKIPPRTTKSKDQYYLELCEIVATRSKDPSTQCGAVIVDQNGYPLGYGYNGLPRRINDNDISWERPDKYKFIIHSEENAINHSDRNRLIGATLYVNNKPCPSCMLRIIDAGIARVVFINRASPDSESSLNDQNWQDSLKIASLTDIVIESFSYDDSTNLYLRGSVWGKFGIF